MKIMLMGDIHGDFHHIKKFIESDCEILIQLGDWGFGFKCYERREKNFYGHFERQYPNKKILIVPGNHENYNKIEKLDDSEIFDGKTKKLRENIFFLNRGELFNINGYSFLSIGGGESIDKHCRTINVDWWEQETITSNDIWHILDKFKEHKKINAVFSHEMPHSFMEECFANRYCKNNSNGLLEVILEDNNIDFDYWFGGHIHINEEVIVNNTTVTSLGIGETIIIEI